MTTTDDNTPELGAADQQPQWIEQRIDPPTGRHASEILEHKSPLRRPLSTAVVVVALALVAASLMMSNRATAPAATATPATAVLPRGTAPNPVPKPSPANGNADVFFGFDHGIVADVQPNERTWVAIGCTSTTDIAVAAAKRDTEGWHRSGLTEVGMSIVGCSSCSTLPTTPQLVGNTNTVAAACPDGGRELNQTIVVAGEADGDHEPGVLMSTYCPARATIEGSEIVLELHGPGANPYPHPDRPTFRLAWHAPRFSTGTPGEDALYHWYCVQDTNIHPWPGLDTTELARYWQPHDSLLGPVHILDRVIFVDGEHTCLALDTSWNLNAINKDGSRRDPRPDTHPYASALGIAPPSGQTDWFVECVY